MITYVMPTHNRPAVLRETLDTLARLPRHDAEAIVVDNASSMTMDVPRVLDNGVGVTLIRRARNEGAAGRNAGVRASEPASEWIVMLDDDSAPLTDHLGFVQALDEQPREVAAVQAEVWLGEHESGSVGLSGVRRREAGGLPEVFVGCGVAIRRQAFLDAGGYDPTFDYYVEEYDLAAKLLLAGGRVAFDERFQVEHRKVQNGRDFGRIVRRLVRNNAWVLRRYAPDDVCAGEILRTIGRYAKIAQRERAPGGYAIGVAELGTTLARQPRREMPSAIWERFTGLSHAREALRNAYQHRAFTRAALVSPGKNAHVVRDALRAMGVSIVSDAGNADALVVATMSPGPMRDAFERVQREHPKARVIAPWLSDRAKHSSPMAIVEDEGPISRLAA